jgi:hypothetical protein
VGETVSGSGTSSNKLIGDRWERGICGRDIEPSGIADGQNSKIGRGGYVSDGTNPSRIIDGP